MSVLNSNSVGGINDAAKTSAESGSVNARLRKISADTDRGTLYPTAQRVQVFSDTNIVTFYNNASGSPRRQIANLAYDQIAKIERLAIAIRMGGYVTPGGALPDCPLRIEIVHTGAGMGAFSPVVQFLIPVQSGSFYGMAIQPHNMIDTTAMELSTGVRSDSTVTFATIDSSINNSAHFIVPALANPIGDWSLTLRCMTEPTTGYAELFLYPVLKPGASEIVLS